MCGDLRPTGANKELFFDVIYVLFVTTSSLCDIVRVTMFVFICLQPPLEVLRLESRNICKPLFIALIVYTCPHHRLNGGMLNGDRLECKARDTVELC